MKTSELTGAALDWAVAKVRGVNIQYHQQEGWVINTLVGWVAYRPSTDWSLAGPIIDREIFKLFRNVGGTWTAQMKNHTRDGTVSGQMTWHSGAGPTPLLAVMRCFVAARLGDEIELPEELT